MEKELKSIMKFVLSSYALSKALKEEIVKMVSSSEGISEAEVTKRIDERAEVILNDSRKEFKF